MKINIQTIDWGNVAAVNKALQPWLKTSPSRTELARVAPLLFKNVVLTECAIKADLKKAEKGLLLLIHTRPYDFGAKAVVDILSIITKLAPLHAAFQGTSDPKPTLYKKLQHLVDDAMVTLCGLKSDKYGQPEFSVSYDQAAQTFNCTIQTGITESDVLDALAEFFENTDQGYLDLLSSIKDRKAMEDAVPEVRGCARPVRPVMHQALTRAL